MSAELTQALKGRKGIKQAAKTLKKGFGLNPHFTDDILNTANKAFKRGQLRRAGQAAAILYRRLSTAMNNVRYGYPRPNSSIKERADPSPYDNMRDVTRTLRKPERKGQKREVQTAYFTKQPNERNTDKQTLAIFKAVEILKKNKLITTPTVKLATTPYYITKKGKSYTATSGNLGPVEMTGKKSFKRTLGDFAELQGIKRSMT